MGNTCPNRMKWRSGRAGFVAARRLRVARESLFCSWVGGRKEATRFLLSEIP